MFKYNLFSIILIILLLNANAFAFKPEDHILHNNIKYTQMLEVNSYIPKNVYEGKILSSIKGKEINALFVIMLPKNNFNYDEEHLKKIKDLDFFLKSNFILENIDYISYTQEHINSYKILLYVNQTK
jgi:hypothetical protein